MRESSKLLLAGLIAFLVFLTITKPAYSGIGTFTFRKVADTTTPIPGGTGNFVIFESPSIDGGSVAFKGAGSSGQSGIYLDTGGPLVLIADKSTPIPGGTGNFTFLNTPSFGGGNVAFVGNGSSGQEGIYIGAGGPLDVVADLNTPIPGGTGNFTSFPSGPISADGGNVAFVGIGSSSQSGIYIGAGGPLDVVAGSGGAPSIDGGSVAFKGAGIFIVSAEGPLVVVADTSTPNPWRYGNLY